MSHNTSKSKSDNYLYRSFRLTHVHTAHDLTARAHTMVSLSVLAGGLLVAIILFTMHRAIVKAELLVSTQSADSLISIE